MINCKTFSDCENRTVLAITLCSEESLSPLQRYTVHESLCHKETGGREKGPEVDNGMGKEKERGLCQIMCGFVAGFVLHWQWLNKAMTCTIFNGCLKI